MRLEAILLFALALPIQAVPRSIGAVTLQHVPLFYEKNVGQFPPDAEYLGRGLNFNIALSRQAASLTLPDQDQVRLEWEGSAPSPLLIGEWSTGGVSNYLREKAEPTRPTSAHHYGRVRYVALYPGIDLVFYGTRKRPEFDFVLQPHADPSVIRIRIRGKATLSIERDGQLSVNLRAGTVRLGAPTIYQPCSSGACSISGRYRLLADDLIALDIAQYNRTLPLIVDPSLTASYFGGTDLDIIAAVATDGAGNLYITGYTRSADFPATQGASKTTLSPGQSDAFVVKMNPSMNSVIYATFIGGIYDDYGRAIAVDASGAAYITGSTIGRFPITQGAVRTRPTAAPAIFVAKLSTDGSTVVYSTYLDGAGAGQGIAVDSGGNAYVAGWTYTATFTTTPGAVQRSHMGGNDAFVTKLNNQGTTLTYSTLLGGKKDDQARGIQVTPSGEVIVVGFTTSADFPTSPGAYQTALVGKADAFMTRLSADGAQIAYSTFLGGSSDDRANAVALDGSNNAFIAGETESSNFPLQNPFQSVRRGASDAFIAKVNSSNGSLAFSTYLGGDGFCSVDDTFRKYSCDAALGIGVHPSGRAYVTGVAGADFPTVGSPQQPYGGEGDAFFAELSASGSQLLYSGYVGGTLGDVGLSLAVSTFVVIGGVTVSTDIALAAGGLNSNARGGPLDGLLARYGDCAAVFLSSGSNFPAAGGTYPGLAVSAPPNCSWTVTSSQPWMTVTNASGSGSGQFTLTLAANTVCGREGTLSLASGAAYTVKQSYSTCALFPGSESWFPASGGTFTITIWTSSPSTTWSVASLNSFTTVPDGLNRTGTGTVTLTVMPNTTGAYRSGQLWMHPFTAYFEIKQPAN